MGSEALKVIGYNDRHLISDFFIPLSEPESSPDGTVVSSMEFTNAYAYIGRPEARALFDGSDPQLTAWLSDIYEKSDRKLKTSDNFRLEHEGTLFRAHRQRTVAGHTLALRAIPSKVPSVDDLRMDPILRALLMSSNLLYGGLVIVAASNGQGKTTTVSATVASRLERFDGHCNAAEDPPELPLHGQHGRGKCEQIPVYTRPGEPPGSGFAETLINVRRFFPSINGGGTILMIGEVRNAETAAETLLAAFEGHLVITTFHGSSVIHALSRYLALAAEKLGETSARELMATQLRICHHQKLKLEDGLAGWTRGELSGDTLVNTGIVPAESEAAAAIRTGQSARLQAVLEAQRGRWAKCNTDEKWLSSNAGRLFSIFDPLPNAAAR